jgi:hypothetical protein
MYWNHTSQIQALDDPAFLQKKIILAAQGDDAAQLELWLYYQEYSMVRVQNPKGYDVPERRHWKSRDSELAEKYRTMAKANYHPEAISFHESVKNGNRFSQNGFLLRDSLTGDGSEKTDLYHLDSGHNRYEADTFLGHYASKSYIKLNRHNSDSYNLMVSEIINKALPALEICAKSGERAAATELARIYNMTHWYYRENVFNEELNLRDTSKVTNPAFDLVKADHWSKIALNLSGEETDEKLLDDFFFSQTNTPEGLFNIGVGMSHNNFLKAAYFKKTDSKCSSDPGSDYLKHAANMGNANAAWYLAHINSGDSTIGRYERFCWYNLAGKLGHPNAKVRANYIYQNDPDARQLLTNDGLPLYVNPTEEHRSRFPASVGRIKPRSYTYNFLNEGSIPIMNRLTRGADNADDELDEINQISEIFERKIFDLGVSKSEKERLIREAEIERVSYLQANTSTIKKQLNEEEKAQQAWDRWKSEQGVSALAGISISLLTGGLDGGAGLINGARAVTHALGHSSGPHPGIHNFGDLIFAANTQRALGYAAVAQSVTSASKQAIAMLSAGLKDVYLSDENLQVLEAELKQLSSLQAVTAVAADQSMTNRLRDTSLRQQLLVQGLQNTQLFQSFAHEEGFNSVDTVIEQYQRGGNRKLSDALTHFCFSYADSNELHYILAYSDGLPKSRLLAEDKVLKSLVERQIKPNRDEYIAKSVRVDVLKGANFTLGAEAQRQEPVALNETVASPMLNLLAIHGFATEGNNDIADSFSFYQTRHGDTRFYDVRLKGADGVIGTNTSPKTIQLWDEQRQSNYLEDIRLSNRYGQPTFPTTDNLFLRICAAEYFEPQSVKTDGSLATFKNSPQAPTAYLMVNQVVSHFVSEMAFGTTTDYREVMKDKLLLDGVVAQSFVDFFAKLGRSHNEQFKSQRDKLSRAYKTNTYGTLFQSVADAITVDAKTRFDSFEDIFEFDLNKVLEFSSSKDTQKLIQQFNETRNQVTTQYATTIFDRVKIVVPGSAEHLNSLLERPRQFENIRPPYLS